MARLICLILYLFWFAGNALSFRKDYSPPLVCHLDPTRSPTMNVARAPCICVIMVETARQSMRGSDLVVSLYRVECDDASALRRRVPYSGGLLGVVPSVPLSSLSLPVDVAFGRRFSYRCRVE